MDNWDLYIRALEEYKEKNGSCLVPERYVHVCKNGTKLNLGNWVSNIRQRKKEKQQCIITPERVKQLNELGFVWELESMFDRFYRHALLYKEKYEHMNIKASDEINNYKIGNVYFHLVKEYKNGKLSEKQVIKLKNIGIDITLDKQEKKFKDTMDLARKAVSEGAIITQKNNTYNGVDLYRWYRTHKNKFTEEENEILKQLLQSEHKKAIKIIDIKTNKKYVYLSISEGGKALYYDFCLTDNEKSGIYAVRDRLTGHTKNPIFKNQFRFEYVDD